ncbi:hypothetical protein QVD17_39501 [Tagetes erecta]|uniref:Uncharacterized protein n=1 Tax=Tagetes erecta TaxID=13708 RepID=A0AAD8JNN0_TARER|nr:hypothetical protein QVD17_39501 [Tagetes erecta]
MVVYQSEACCLYDLHMVVWVLSPLRAELDLDSIVVDSIVLFRAACVFVIGTESLHGVGHDSFCSKKLSGALGNGFDAWSRVQVVGVFEIKGKQIRIRVAFQLSNSLDFVRTKLRQIFSSQLSFVRSNWYKPRSLRCKRGHSVWIIRSVMNNKESSINDDEAIEPTRILLERLFAQTQKLEEKIGKDLNLPQDILWELNLGSLESDLQASLTTREILNKQTLEIEKLRKIVVEKDEELQIATKLLEIEQEKLKVVEGNLEKHTMDWFLAQEEMKNLVEEASKHTVEGIENLQEYARVKKLLGHVRLELVSSQKSLTSSRTKMEDQQEVLVKKLLELKQHRESLNAYAKSLGDAKVEIESERVKLRVAEAQNQELKQDLSIEKDAFLELMLKEKGSELSQAQEALSEDRNETDLNYFEATTVVKWIFELTNKVVSSIEHEGQITSKEQELETELDLIMETLRSREMEVLHTRRALLIKEDDLKFALNKLIEQENEMKEMKQELTKDAGELRKLYEMVQERMGEKSLGELAMEQLELEAAQLEVEAATIALEKIAEMSWELLRTTSLLVETDYDMDLSTKDIPG